MRPVVQALYRNSLKSVAAIATAEEQQIAMTRFVEYLPPLFTLPDMQEPLDSIVRRAYRYPFKTGLEQTKAISNAFAFLKSVNHERKEVEILAHWTRFDDCRSWALGASIISYGYQSMMALPDTTTKAPALSSSTSTALTASSRPSSLPLTSFTAFLDVVNLQLEAIYNKIRSELIIQQLVTQSIEKNSTSKRPKKKKQKTPMEYGGVSIITSSGSEKLTPGEKNVADAMKRQSQLTTLQQVKVLATVEVETIVRAIIRVLLEDLRFTAVTVSPIEGFLIDKALTNRVASASMISLLFAAVGEMLGLTCGVTLDQRCPMVRVEGYRGLTCFVNMADGGSILTPNEALEYHVKCLQNAPQARVALRAADPRVVFSGMLASLLVATGHSDPEVPNPALAHVRQLLKAQLMFLGRVR